MEWLQGWDVWDNGDPGLCYHNWPFWGCFAQKSLWKRGAVQVVWAKLGACKAKTRMLWYHLYSLRWGEWLHLIHTQRSYPRDL